LLFRAVDCCEIAVAHLVKRAFTPIPVSLLSGSTSLNPVQRSSVHANAYDSPSAEWLFRRSVGDRARAGACALAGEFSGLGLNLVCPAATRC